MPPAPMYASFAAVTLLVLGLLVVLARASQAMFEGSGEAQNGRGRADSKIPATGAARIERHAETGQSRVERREQKILDADEEATGDEEKNGAEENDEGEENDENPWAGWEETETPWSENPAETDARRAHERAVDERATGQQPTDEVATDERATDERGRGSPTDEQPHETGELEFTSGALLANVALSQGLFGVAILGAAWLAKIPPAALGVHLGDPGNVGLPAVGVGVAVGVALYLGNELSALVVDAAGVEYSEGLREALAPDSLRGWVVLLGGVLPIIAGFEELLFRAALVGAFSAGFGLSPWILAVFSTVAFAIGHGAQGPGGVAVTGLLGFALAAAFVLTGSLLVVVVAHYLVNALEFGVHEGLGIEWT